MTTTATHQPDGVAARLLDAAATRFVGYGVTKTTMAEIAAEAGVSKPTLYARYADKRAVVDALVRRETADLVSRVRDNAARQPDAPRALQEAFVTAVRWLDRHPFVRKSLDVEPDLLLPLLTEPRGVVRAAGLDVYAEIVRAGVRNGELKPVDPDRVAEVWWRLGLSYVLAPAGAARDPKALREMVRESLLEGLVA